MGKDKKPTAAPVVASGGKNAPPPVADAKAGGRGHRQRGAGTVITAKPAVVTDDGIVLKAHERLPAQILHEYCQREKRPTPRYYREPPGLRFKVVLEDPKNSRHDMQFCPVQSFESETMARHYAALLALFHVQKSIPLERKLPEPFSTTWLQMIRNNSAEGTVTTAASAKEPATTSSAPSSSPPSTSQNPQTSTASSGGPTAPQWLCDSCATPNFVMNANGTVRTKCFKCQTPKPEVVSMTSAPSKLHSNTQPALKGANNSTNSIPKSEKKPQVVLDLQAKGNYVSQAERDAEMLNRKLRQTSNMTYLEALKNANPLNRIQIPLEMRERLEMLLGIARRHDDPASLASTKSSVSSIQKPKKKNIDSKEPLELIASLSSEDCLLYFAGWMASALLAVKQSTWWKEEMSTSDGEMSWWLHSLLLSIGSELLLQKFSGDSLSTPSDYLTSFSHRYQQYQTTTLNSGEAAEKRAVLNEEQEAIVAILGDNTDTPVEFRHSVTGDVEVVIQNMALPDAWTSMLKTKTSCSLTATIYIPVNCAYPNESPVVMVSIAGYPNGKLLPTSIQDDLMRVNIYVNEKLVSDWQGALVVFEVFSLLQHLTIEEVVAAVSVNHETLIGKLNSALGITNNDSEKEEVADMSVETLSVAEESIASSDVSTIGDISHTQQPKTTHSKASSHSKHAQPKAHPFWRRAVSHSHSSLTSFQEEKVPLERRNLPAWQQRNAFLSAIADQDCVIVTGETGCGKTTQIPQFLHETYPHAKILICQPRRLAATGVAQRVAEEVDMMLAPAAHGHTSSTNQQATQSKNKHQSPVLHQMNPVGYMVKGDSRISTHTKIAFVTYGVLLRRLQDDPALDSIDFVILDEVHERGMDSDFCLALLIEAIQRRRQRANIPPLKLILMSATISTATFRDYLLQQLYRSMSSQADAVSRLCPIIDIPGRTYPVTEFFKQEFETFVKSLSLNKPVANVTKRATRDTENGDSDSDYSSEDDDELVHLDAPGPRSPDIYTPERRELSLNNPHRTKDIDYDLLIRLVFNLILGRAPSPSEDTTSSGDNESEKWQKAEGCILIFLPGVPEITKVLHHLRTHWPTIVSSQYSSSHKPPRLELLPLHGNLSPQEQRQVFVTYPKTQNVIKIVAATNVAEASVTIPDVTVVIDTCRVKEMSFDTASTHAWQLTMQFAAKDALRQRKGRAGRVQQGRCYHLITRNTFENRLAAISTPEMLRLPLDNVLLQTFAMVQMQQQQQHHQHQQQTRLKKDQYARCLELLQKCPSPPTAVAISRAKEALLSLQALDSTSSNEETDGYVLSPLGSLLAKLPMLPRIGKLLIYGRLLQCTLPSVCIAAALSSGSGNKPIFLSSPAGTGGDLAALQAAIQAVKERVLRDNPALHKELTTPNHSNNLQGMYSDYYIIAQLTMKYLTCHHQTHHSVSTSVTATRRQFCKQHCLHFERMQEIAQSVGELIDDVRDLGLLKAGLVPVAAYDVHATTSHAVSRHEKHDHRLENASRTSLFAQVVDVQHPVFNKYAQQPRLLAAVFVAGLYPQVMQIQRPPKKFMEVMGAAVEKDVLAKEIAFYVPTVQNEDMASEAGVGQVKDNNDDEDAEDHTPYMSPPSSSSSSSVSTYRFQNKREQDIYFSACVVRRPDVTLQRVQRVFVHPSSINFHNTSFQQKHKVVSNYLLYAEKQSVVTGYDAQTKTEQVKIYVRDTSEVSPLALVLFGGVVQVVDIPADVTLDDSTAAGGGGAMNKRVLVTVDKWIRFYATPRDAKIMVTLKQALSSLLQTQLSSGVSPLEEDEATAAAMDGVSLTSGGTTKASHSLSSVTASEDWQVHPLIEATCALLDAEVTVTGTTSGLTVLSTIGSK